MAFPKQVKPNIDLVPPKILSARREELLEYINKDGTYLPKSVLHADLDQGMLDFVKTELETIVSGQKVPVVDKIITTQNWSQFTETWDFNDLNGYLPEFTFHLMISSIILVAAFLVDDIKELKASSRLLIQILLSLYIIYITDISLNNLGDLFGFGKIYLGIFSIPFTVFCVVGIMNAFNMIDGINGLCSGYSMTALLLIGFFSGLIYDSLMVLFIGSILGFLLFNLMFFGKKIQKI